MRHFVKHIIFIFLFLLISNCEDPSPIELINEEDEVEINVVNAKPSSYVITGYDSTGIAADDSDISSIIAFNGIKNTFERITYYKAYAQAVFFDTSKPVLSPGGLLLGYKTFDVENVKFNDKNALKLPFIIKFREDLVPKDSLIGNKYAVTFRRALSPENLDFRYNSNLNVEVTKLDGSRSNLSIKVPDEIVGNVTLQGESRFNNLRIVLSWNKSSITSGIVHGEFSEEVILGGKFKNRDELVPLVRLRNFRNNQFEIPTSLLEDILRSDKFDYLVFTFLRKITSKNTFNQLGDIRFVSQSIHNIWVKL